MLLQVSAWGARGGFGRGGGGACDAPGLGGLVRATIEVASGSALQVVVGGRGVNYGNFQVGGWGSEGWNGGGRGGWMGGTHPGTGMTGIGAGGGGGASDVRDAGGTRLVVAGGGVEAVDAAGVVMVEVQANAVVLRATVVAGDSGRAVQLHNYSKVAMAVDTMMGEGAGATLEAVPEVLLEAVVAPDMPMVRILNSKLEFEMVMV